MPTPEPHRFMVKVVLVGDKAVGKTSLIRRYVTDQFDDRYLLTLGAKVTKKVEEVQIEDRNLRAHVELNIWDIMGQTGFRELAKEAYFHGARGILAVVDVTRASTLEGIGEWVHTVEEVTGPVPTVLLANKSDLVAQTAVTPFQVTEAAHRLGCPSFQTSAKTGENVEAAFQELAEQVAHKFAVH